METLWEELSRPDHELEPSAWRAKKLDATEPRLSESKDQMLDWNTAKHQLRSKFN
jgi:hypothetical protein